MGIAFIIGMLLGIFGTLYFLAHKDLLKEPKRKNEVPLEAEFFKIPTDKIGEFFRLQKAHNRVGGGFGTEENIALWSFIRETVGNDLEVYEKDGNTYSWSYKILNSNNVVIHNLGGYNLSSEAIIELYAKCKN